MSRRDARFVQLAAEEANKSSVGMQHGCIAVMHGKIIARSFNTACRLSPTIWCSCHAETEAIKKITSVQREPQRITLYIVRITTHGGLHASAPCLHCMRAIQRCPGIKRIIYSEADGSITRCSPHKYCTQHVSWGMRGKRSSLIRRGSGMQSPIKCTHNCAPRARGSGTASKTSTAWCP